MLGKTEARQGEISRPVGTGVLTCRQPVPQMWDRVEMVENYNNNNKSTHGNEGIQRERETERQRKIERKTNA